MKKIILFIIFTLLLVGTASAATIHGSIYDLSLEKIENSIVEINTQPTQRQIAENGDYSFEVPQGNYLITAKTIYNETLVQEQIEITNDGTYILDLISFLDLEDIELLNESDLDLDEDLDVLEGEKPNRKREIIVIILVIIVAILIFLKYRKVNKKIKDEEDLTKKVLNIIKKQDGRITQKELRKLLPYSEAKISLVITELESKNKIKKIKKGRSNIIILKN